MLISINFHLAERQAREYMQCADDLAAQHNKLESIIAEIRKAWRGVTSETYLRKLETFRNTLGEDATRLRNDAAAFRRTIEEIRRLDEESAAAMRAMADSR